MMKRNKNIDFNLDTYDESRRVKKRILWAVVAAVLAGGLSFLVLMARNNFDFSRFIGRRADVETTVEETAAPPAPSVAAPLFSDENAVNILFIVADGQQLDLCCLASFSEAEASVKIKGVSPEVRFAYAGAADTLASLFAGYGSAAVREAIEGRGVPVARMVTMEENNFRQIMKTLGPVTVNVPLATEFAVDGILYTLDAGEQEMNGEQLLRFMKYAYAEDDRVFNQAGVVAEILRTHLTPENVERGEDFFSTLVNYTVTDISAFDYARFSTKLADFLRGAPSITVID